jgi:hypothetical protein
MFHFLIYVGVTLFCILAAALIVRIAIALENVANRSRARKQTPEWVVQASPLPETVATSWRDEARVLGIDDPNWLPATSYSTIPYLHERVTIGRTL